MGQKTPHSRSDLAFPRMETTTIKCVPRVDIGREFQIEQLGCLFRCLNSLDQIVGNVGCLQSTRHRVSFQVFRKLPPTNDNLRQSSDSDC